jgi:hypothetical protein
MTYPCSHPLAFLPFVLREQEIYLEINTGA